MPDGDASGGRLPSRVARADARRLPWGDATVDLVVTSPPYYQARVYEHADGAEVAGQIGAEEGVDAYLKGLWAVTAECWRVLADWGVLAVVIDDTRVAWQRRGAGPGGAELPDKSLIGVPWRYALGCTDGRADPDGRGWVWVSHTVWHKPAAMPESVTDRPRDSHETVIVLAKRPDHYGDAYALAEPYRSRPKRRLAARVDPPRPDRQNPMRLLGAVRDGVGIDGANGLGRIPGDVWAVDPLPVHQPDYLLVRPDGAVDGVSDPPGLVPPWEGGDRPSPAMAAVAADAAARWAAGEPLPRVVCVDHRAPFPAELVRRLVALYSPADVCLSCGQPRRPKVGRPCPACGELLSHVRRCPGCGTPVDAAKNPARDRQADGYGWRPGDGSTLGAEGAAAVREMRCACDDTSAPTRPGRVADPFCGSGTTMAVADAAGRVGVGCDLSTGYCTMAAWRQQHGDDATPPRAQPAPPGQPTLFEGLLG